MAPQNSELKVSKTAPDLNFSYQSMCVDFETLKGNVLSNNLYLFKFFLGFPPPSGYRCLYVLSYM